MNPENTKSVVVPLNVRLGYPPPPEGQNTSDLYAITATGTIRRFYATHSQRWKEISTGIDLSAWIGHISGYFYATDFNLNQRENHE